MMQLIKKAIIKRFIKLGQYVVTSLGGDSKANYISPKGLYSKATKGNAIIFQLGEDEANKAVMAIQNPVELSDGDVIITDDKSYIKFNFSNGVIDIVSSGLTHNGVNIGDTHTHGGIMPGNSNTGVPQ